MIYEASAQQTTIFVTTHYMDEAEYCDRISIMVDGDIAALGTPKELKQYYQADNMDQVFYFQICDHKFLCLRIFVFTLCHQFSDFFGGTVYFCKDIIQIGLNFFSVVIQ